MSATEDSAVGRSDFSKGFTPPAELLEIHRPFSEIFVDATATESHEATLTRDARGQ